MEHIYANLSASVSELKRNPTALLNLADGQPVAILNHNKPTAYLVSAEIFARILDALEDMELLELAKTRLEEKDQAIQVKLDDL